MCWEVNVWVHLLHTHTYKHISISPSLLKDLKLMSECACSWENWGNPGQLYEVNCLHITGVCSRWPTWLRALNADEDEGSTCIPWPAHNEREHFKYPHPIHDQSSGSHLVPSVRNLNAGSIRGWHHLDGWVGCLRAWSGSSYLRQKRALSGLWIIYLLSVQFCIGCFKKIFRVSL